MYKRQGMFRYGYGNAISVVFIAICLLATVLLNKAFADRSEGKEAKRLARAEKKAHA